MNRNYDNRRIEPRFNRNDNRQNQNTNDQRLDRNSDNVRNINLITRFNQSQDNLLLESEDESESSKNNIAVPVIVSKIGNENVEILIDSGSEVTVVSEKFFEKVKLSLQVPVLPVTNVTISVAVGGKVQRVKYQTFLPIKIDDIPLK